MMTHEEIEMRLLDAVAVEPSDDAWRWLDERVARIVSGARPARRPMTWGPRAFWRTVLVVGATLLLAGAVAGAMGLLERTVEVVPGWKTAWEKAEIVGMSEIDGELTVTLERAYVDLNQVMVFLSIEGLAAPRSSDGIVIDHLTIYDVNLRDQSGRQAVLGTGIDAAEADLGVAVRSFQFDPLTPPAGTYELTITSIGYGAAGPDCVAPCAGDPIEGSWRFTFDLPDPTGTVVAVDVADTSNGTTLRLTELRVTGTMVVARIAMFVEDVPVAYWGFVPSVGDLRHGDTSYFFWSSRHILDVPPFEEGPGLELATTEGAEDATGTWEIVIPEVDYALHNGDEPTHVAGPWTLAVEIP